MSDWNDVLSKIESIEKQILDNKKGNVNTKYQIIALFKHIRDAIGYRMVKSPLIISSDGKKFRCPTCGELIEITDEGVTYDIFEFCPLCGQRLQEEGTRERRVLYG